MDEKQQANVEKDKLECKTTFYEQLSSQYLRNKTKNEELKKFLMKSDLGIIERTESIEQLNYYFNEPPVTLEEVKETFSLEKQDGLKEENDYLSLSIKIYGQIESMHEKLLEIVLIEQNEISEDQLTKWKSCNQMWYYQYLQTVNNCPFQDSIQQIFNIDLNKKRCSFIFKPKHIFQLQLKCDIALIICSADTQRLDVSINTGQLNTDIKQAICDGSSNIVFVINSMESILWKEEQFKSIQNKILNLYQDLTSILTVQWVPISTKLNLNIQNMVSDEMADWVTPKLSLLGQLKEIEPIPRNPNGPLRISISSVLFENKDVIIFGRIESGSISEFTWVTIMPQKEQFLVEAIYNSRTKRVNYATAGETIMIVVIGEKITNIKHGNLICSTYDLCYLTKQLLGEVNVLQAGSSIGFITYQKDCILTINGFETKVHFQVVAKVDIKTKQQLKTNMIKEGEKGIIKIESLEVICAEKYETFPQLSRFYLRNESGLLLEGIVSRIKPI